MKDNMKIVTCFIFGVLFVPIVRWLNCLVVGLFGFSASCSLIPSNNTGFDSYRDFVTIVTGLLALIVGAIGIGSYISFKKFKEEEEKIEDRRKKLDMFLKIEEARNASETEAGYKSAIELYNLAERDHCEYYLLFVLRGDSYYFLGKTENYRRALHNYEKAKELKNDSSRAWFGCGQAQFKILEEASRRDRPTVDLTGVAAANLRLANRDVVTINSKDKVYECIECVEQAIGCGYPEAPARLELGKMFRSIGDDDKALAQYREAYRSNSDHAACRFYYCYHWVFMHANGLYRVERADLDYFVKLLKKVSVFDVYNSKAAYALLWYLYKLVDTLGDASEVKLKTDQILINDLFETIA